MKQLNQYQENMVLNAIEMCVRERDYARHDQESPMFLILSMEAYSFVEELED